MNIFYAPGLTDEFIWSLEPDESHHAIRVLRLGPGAEIILVNGTGGWFEARITRPDPRSCEVEILKARSGVGTPSYHLHIAMAPTKQIDRFEWFIEKATEIGISEITPIICEHSERKELRTDRLIRLVISAMKQSLHAFHPVIHEPVRLTEFIRVDRIGTKAIAHCQAGDKHWLDEILTVGELVTILIGPEGDFSETEIRQSIEKGYQPVTLGESRLRTETAGVVACHTVSWILSPR